MRALGQCLKQAHWSQRCGRSLRWGPVAESPTIALLAFIHDAAIATFERERNAKLLVSDIMPSLRAPARICLRTPTRPARGKAVNRSMLAEGPPPLPHGLYRGSVASARI